MNIYLFPKRYFDKNNAATRCATYIFRIRWNNKKKYVFGKKHDSYGIIFDNLWKSETYLIFVYSNEQTGDFIIPKG